MSTRSKKMFQMLTLALCVFAFVGVIMVGSTTVAFCDTGVSSTIKSAVSGITEEIYNIMKAIIVPFCIVALAFAGFQFLIGGNQGAEKARKVIIAVACALGFIIFAPIVVKAITTIVQSGNANATDDWNSFNPLA
jgi:uncharacterized protein YggT (Ycf19 family)